MSATKTLKYIVNIDKFEYCADYSAQYKYDVLFDLDNYIEDYVSLYIISVDCQVRHGNYKIALIASSFGDLKRFSYVQEDGTLIMLCDGRLILINLAERTLIKNIELCGNTNGFGLYPFDDGYVAHTEEVIFKLNKSGDTVWEFWGPDIWATPNENSAFVIDGDNIRLESFDGQKFVLNKFGKNIFLSGLYKNSD